MLRAHLILQKGSRKASEEKLVLDFQLAQICYYQIIWSGTFWDEKHGGTSLNIQKNSRASLSLVPYLVRKESAHRLS